MPTLEDLYDNPIAKGRSGDLRKKKPVARKKPKKLLILDPSDPLPLVEFADCLSTILNAVRSYEDTVGDYNAARKEAAEAVADAEEGLKDVKKARGELIRLLKRSLESLEEAEKEPETGTLSLDDLDSNRFDVERLS